MQDEGKGDGDNLEGDHILNRGTFSSSSSGDSRECERGLNHDDVARRPPLRERGGMKETGTREA